MADGLLLDASSLKAAQLRAIHRMLAFNDDSAGAASSSSGAADGPHSSGSPFTTTTPEYHLPPAGSSHNQWKVLIYDAHCRSIISPILSVQQLRRRGVTLHLLLDSDREPIPDVPAIYFCCPTKHNLSRIAQDCAKQLYGRVHLNFVTKLDRTLMEDFAQLVVQSGSLHTIASLHDQYLDYTCLERQLFSLRISQSYALFNGPGATEQMIEQATTNVAYGLFSVVASLGQIPILRCPKGGAPEMVARKLHRMIMEHPTLLRSSHKGLGGGGSGGGGANAPGSRPLLVVLDRNADLITPVQHTSTYQALIDDVLHHAANRVEFEVTDDTATKGGKPNPKKIAKRYDLDPDQDPFYAAQKFQPFPEAIESNGTELQEVTQREQEVRSKASRGNSNTGPAALDPLDAGTGDLATAVDSLPALLDRKKQLEVHTSILQAVMNEVASRDIPQFYELESALATGAYKNDPVKAKRDVLALVGDPDKGQVQDKVRLLLVYALATAAKTSDLDEASGALEQAVQQSAQGGQPDHSNKSARDQLTLGLRALSYVKQLRSMHMLPAAADMRQTLEGASSFSDSRGSSQTAESTLSSFMAKATTQATGLLAKATDRVTSMLGKIHKHHATLVVEHLCDFKHEDETYLYLDPKVKGDVDVLKLRGAAAMGQPRPPVHRVIAFVVGGGCYGEYQNLQLMMAQSSSSGGGDHRRRQITYGSTEILDATAFLEQLGQLAQ